MKHVLDFEDFKACIAAQGIALEMSDNDFFEYRTKVSKGKDTYYPYLDRIVGVQFRRGSNEIYWKTDMRVLDFSHGNFLQKKFIKVWMQKNLISRKPCPRGIPLQKKEDIVKK